MMRDRVPAARRYSMLALGTGISLLAVGGRWDVPLAAWLSGVFLLRFTRISRPLVGAAGAWIALGIGSAFWLAESGLPVLSPYLLLCLLIDTALTLPFLVDRLGASTLAYPLARVAAEYLIAMIGPFGGLVGSLAVTQHQNLPLMQACALTGSWGVSFLVAWFASAANQLWQGWPPDRATLLQAAAFLGVTMFALAAGGLRMAVDPTHTPTVRVAGISPGEQTWRARAAALNRYHSPADIAAADPNTVRTILAPANEQLLTATQQQAQAGVRIVVWSETAAVILGEDRHAFLAQVGQRARTDGTYILVGLGVITRQVPHEQNQAVLVGPTGQVLWTYDKTHPVPGMEALAPGPGAIPVVSTPYGRLAAVICFDADFPALMRQASGRADIMLVPSHDWREFGAAHAAAATVRAVEGGFSLVRPSAEGLSQAVDAHGRPLATADFFAAGQQIMVGDVPTRGTTTTYRWTGEVFAWTCAALTLLIVRPPCGRRPWRPRATAR